MAHVQWLDNDPRNFPSPDLALKDPNGLLAMGGDLSRQRLLVAYRAGIFPWYEEGQPILWWSPNPRSVFVPGKIRVSRSLRKSLRNKGFMVTFDRDFQSVIAACAASRGNSGTWITRDMQLAYCDLHHAGFGHSAEVWLDGQLVGGLYGIALGELFFGESMFSIATDASKVALVHLDGQLASWGFKLIDCQVQNGHLDSLGAKSMPAAQFRSYLDRYAECNHRPGPWHLEWQYTDRSEP